MSLHFPIISNLGWDSPDPDPAGEPGNEAVAKNRDESRREFFRQEAPPLKLRPTPPPRSYWAIKVSTPTAGGGGGDYFSFMPP